MEWGVEGFFLILEFTGCAGILRLYYVVVVREFSSFLAMTRITVCRQIMCSLFQLLFPVCGEFTLTLQAMLRETSARTLARDEKLFF